MKSKSSRTPVTRRTEAAHADYATFLQAVVPVNVALTSCTLEIDRPRYYRFAVEPVEGVTVERRADLATSVRRQSRELLLFSGKAHVEVSKTDEPGEPLLRINAAYEVMCAFNATAPQTPEQVERFAQNELKLILWPYVREFVADISGRMSIQPLLLPLLHVQVAGVPASHTRALK